MTNLALNFKLTLACRNIEFIEHFSTGDLLDNYGNLLPPEQLEEFQSRLDALVPSKHLAYERVRSYYQAQHRSPLSLFGVLPRDIQIKWEKE